MSSLRFAVMVASALLIGCSATAPTNASRLVIQAESDTLKVSERQQLKAVTTDSSGRSVAVASAKWSSERPEFCAVDEQGVVTALKPRATTITASDGVHTASITLNVVPDADGEWAGQTRMLSETRLSGEGPYLHSPDVGKAVPYQLRVSQQHGRIDATASWAALSLVHLVGQVDSRGAIAVAGSGTLPDGLGMITTDPWTGQLDDSGQHLQGSFVSRHQFGNFWGRQVIEYRIQILDLTRKAR